jgi:hypothetical protein
MHSESVHGFATGDLVKATVPAGKKAGVHQGRVAVRATGCFNIQIQDGMVQGISHRRCTRGQRGMDMGINNSRATQTRGWLCCFSNV